MFIVLIQRIKRFHSGSMASQEQVQEILNQNDKDSGISRNSILEKLRENEQKLQQQIQASDLERRERELNEKIKQSEEEEKQLVITYGNGMVMKFNRKISELESECMRYMKEIESEKMRIEDHRKRKEIYVNDLREDFELCGIYNPPEQKLISKDTIRIDQQIKNCIRTIASYEESLDNTQTELIKLKKPEIQYKETQKELSMVRDKLDPMRKKMGKIKRLILEEEQRPRYLAYATEHCIKYNTNDRFDLFRECNKHHHWRCHDGIRSCKLHYRCDNDGCYRECYSDVVMHCTGDFNSNYGIKAQCSQCPERNYKCSEPPENLSLYNLDSFCACFVLLD